MEKRQKNLRVGDRVKYAGWKNDEGVWSAAEVAVVKANPTITPCSPKNEKRNRSNQLYGCGVSSLRNIRTPPTFRIPHGGGPFFPPRRDAYIRERATTPKVCSRGIVCNFSITFGISFSLMALLLLLLSYIKKALHSVKRSI